MDPAPIPAPARTETLPLVADVTWGRVRLVVSGRRGGASRPPYDTANLSTNVGDDPAAVQANRAALAAAAGVPGRDLTFLSQVHGDRVVAAGTAGGADGQAPQADAVVVTAVGSAAAVMAADCLPLLLADPDRGLAAAVHVGRRGLVLDIAAAAVARLHEAGARRLHALLGPAVCAGCYEVPAAMQEEVAAAVPGSAARTRAGTPAVDIRAGLTRRLGELGVVRVESVDLCTAEDPGLFSHRRDQVTGRFAGAVAVLA